MGFITPSNLQEKKAGANYPSDGGTGLQDLPIEKVEWRLNPPKPKAERYRTGIPTLDEYLGGGLPVGTTILWGNAGSGKSLLAKQLAMNAKGRVLYICCETLLDAPNKQDYPHVDTVDYTKFVPNYRKAVAELFTFIKKLDPKPVLVVVDSLTTFLGESKLSVSEGSIREAVWTIHKNAEGLCPIVGVSEVRGTGFNEYTAGGKGVMHGCSMLVRLEKHVIRWESQLPRFPNHRLGDVVFTLEVQKDKHGLAMTKPYNVSYSPERGIYGVFEVKQKEGTQDGGTEPKTEKS